MDCGSAVFLKSEPAHRRIRNCQRDTDVGIMTRARSFGALAIGIPLLLAACGGRATAPASSPSASAMPEASGNLTAKFVSLKTATGT